MNPTLAVRELPLPEPRLEGAKSLERVLFERRSIRDYSDEPLTVAQTGQLLWSCQGITSRDGLRTTPSAGALYPLEIYAAIRHVNGLAPGVYHYRPGPGLLEHRLELVHEGSIHEELFALSTNQEFIRQVPLNILLTSVTSRMAEKYGEAAERYVCMELGHAAQNIHLQAEALGLGSVAVGYMDEAGVRKLLQARVQPLYFVSIGHKINP